MRIVFYSTNSNYFDEQNYLITNLPSNFSKIDSFIKMLDENEDVKKIAEVKLPDLNCYDLD